MSTRQSSTQQLLRLWAAHLLVLCFAIRALVPVGFMPSFSSSDGTLQIVICSAQGAKTLSIPLGDGQSHKQDSRDSCPFATAAVTTAGPAPILLASSFDFAPLALPVPSEDAVHVRVAGPPLGSRGPPV